MANNRYYLYCECGKAKYMGKSLGEGIYNMASVKEVLFTEDDLRHPYKDDPAKAQEEFLEDIYAWMWDHMMHKESGSPHLSGEWFHGEAFKVLTEGDGRIDYSNREMFK